MNKKEISLKSEIPSFKDSLIFRSKTLVFQLQRGYQNRNIFKVVQHSYRENLKSEEVLAESITPLWGEKSEELTEKKWTLGKIQNLRIAAKQLHGLEVPANSAFSFWKQLGRLSSKKGYVIGREVRQGCIIPTIGGGICQLSNALYDAALLANFNILERHGHTVAIPGSLAEIKRDATVFWNYVDLRFSSSREFRIEIELTHQELKIRFRGKKSNLSHSASAQNSKDSLQKFKQQPNDCLTCGETSCFRSVPKIHQPFGEKAFLVDEYWPEYDAWIQKEKHTNDLLLAPLNGRKWKKPNYAWNFEGFKQIHCSTFKTLQRAYAFRRLPAQGAILQQKVLEWDEKLCVVYTKKIPYSAEHLVISQNLLPFLWKLGALSGRTFDVLMTRLPGRKIQEILDAAKQKYPQSRTFNDFRAPEDFLEWENLALNEARKIVTPHSKIAELFPNKTVKLSWEIPTTQEEISAHDGDEVLFPYPTLGRKGAYEMREMAKQLHLKLRVNPKNFEGADFWQGVNVNFWEGREIPNSVKTVIFPAHLEHKPRHILKLASQGFKIIASEACGLEGVQGIQTFKMDELMRLGESLE